MKIFVNMTVAGTQPPTFEAKEVEAEEIKSPWAGYRLFVHEAQDRQGLFCVTEYTSGLSVVPYAKSKEAALEELKKVYKDKKTIFAEAVKNMVALIGLANDELF